MDYIISKAKELAQESLKKKPLAYSGIKNVPRKRGVYLIYNKEDSIIYVGESNKLNVRLLSDHISGELKFSTSSFRRKLSKSPYNLKSGEEMLKWIKQNCLFSWTEIEPKDICHLVEALLITELREKGEPLLNS